MNIKIKTFLLVIIMVIAIIVINSNNPIIIAQSTSNQIGNNTTSTTKSNSTANNSCSIKCSNSELTQLGAATQAFLTGNENKALMYMNQADKTLTGAAKMHLDAAISALQSGDSNMAKKHLGEIEYACGIHDIF